jgi:Core-2/I-Branching enzyme
MKIAYLNLVHRNPRLLARAIKALSGEDAAFFIHVDKKANFEGFADVAGENVFFSERRIPVYWSEFSNVEALLQLIRQAVSSPAGYDYIVFMQGADYPLRSGKYIREFLDRNRGQEFLSMVKVPADGYPISRINTLRFTSDKPIRQFVMRVLAKIGLATRNYKKHLGNLEPYAGDACWALSRDACEYILQVIDRNPAVASYFRYVFCPEESFFHTILGNSPFRSQARRSLLYRYWPKASAHPEMLTSEHLDSFDGQMKIQVEDQFGAGEVLFARKFSDESLELIDRLDAMIARKDQHELEVVR